MSDFKPIGTLSNFKKGSWNNIYQNLDVGSYFPSDTNTQGVQIQERFDFAQRGGNPPSLDMGITQKGKKGYLGKELGDSHNTPLW
ncbi:hypothetical protein HYT91_00960 [Candidatus Pacearchaeota archaeon]|nr:hypothetical protein [Candidatus Pacearchaeota archaeon]